MKSLNKIKAEVERLAELIDAAQNLLPTYGYSEGDGTPHIEVDAGGYHYVQAERGHEYDRWTTEEIDELLYAVFRSVTFSMASNYELKHRASGRDSRRLLFARQAELISALSPKWADRLSIERERLLGLFPLDDNRSARAVLTKELRDQGHPPEDASRIACEKYPEPVRGTVEDGRTLELELRKTH